VAKTLEYLTKKLKGLKLIMEQSLGKISGLEDYLHGYTSPETAQGTQTQDVGDGIT
jgi:hypothetical protein